MARILVIDDEYILRQTIGAVLELEEHEIITAANGREGIDAARLHHPDLILCDVNMPEMDGFEVLLHLSSDRSTASIPFIFLTALSERSVMRRAMERGADDFLTKPFEVPELLRAIDARLSKRSNVVSDYQKRVSALEGAISYVLPHEVRTPLGVILGFAQLLREDSNPPDVQRMARTIETAAMRLNRLTQNIMQAAQLELMRSNPEMVGQLRATRCASPGPVIRYAAEARAAQSSREADLRLEIEAEADCVIFEDDLKKVITELVDNAMKFSAAGQPVGIEARPTAESYRIRVIDQGRGMSPEQLEELGAFSQLERHRYEQQGLGLGLTIAQGLVDLYGGSLSIQSEPEQGTTVTIDLRLA